MNNTMGSHYDCSALILIESGAAVLNHAQKRWSVLYVTIYFSRSLLSLARKNIAKQHRRSSYSVVEVQFQPEEQPFPSSSPQNQPPTVTSPISDGGDFSAVDSKKLAEMVKTKDSLALCDLGGVEGVASVLRTDEDAGIHGDEDEILRRRGAFGSNTYTKQPPKGIFFFVKDAFRDTTILILLVCAALSLGFGINDHGLREGWYEGGSIFVAVFLVVTVSALSNFRQQKQFDKLSAISSNIKIDTVRDGRRQQVSIFDLVVGDVVILKIGDQIPADGLLLRGQSLLQVDESSLTGESDHVGVDCVHRPFLLSGGKVADGQGRMVVTAVGMNTGWGDLMASIMSGGSDERTPLQARLDKLTSSIGKVGLTVAFLVLVVMVIRYFRGKMSDDEGDIGKFVAGKTGVGDVLNAMVGIVAVAVTIVVVAIPEGLPLAVTLTLAYSMKRMMADQAMVRKLSACETMGSADVICTDKTGTLTRNEMKVAKFWMGMEAMEEEGEEENKDDSAGKKKKKRKMIAPQVLRLLHQAVGLNTTGSVYRSKTTGSEEFEFTGSPTEKAILTWAVLELGMDMENLKHSCTVLHVETFNSEKKRSGVSLKEKGDDDHVNVHWKGAAEMVLARCSKYCDREGKEKMLDTGNNRTHMEKIIQGMAASSLRCIAFAHKRIRNKNHQTAMGEGSGTQSLEDDGLTLLGIVGLKDPCRLGVKKAVQTCKDAGVKIKMITGDNVFTAKAIATECGILGPDDQSPGVVVEGSEFRNYQPEERSEKADKILVLARSSPLDKLLMVQCLKQKGYVVAVTGDGTNDAPALKEADIGLSMGVQGTEVAKESSDIVILDDNFESVATVLRWGRCVYNNIQKFIQFQLTVNVAALVINFVSAVSAGEVPLTAVQLLWVNLIMDTLGALALATERPTDDLMRRRPVGRSEPLITNIMWRNLLAQSIYQITVLLFLQFKGESVFSLSSQVNDTVIFNIFVLCQVFNEFNSRKLEEQNVFAGLHRNRLFLGIVVVTVVLQAVMVEFLTKFADTVKLNGWQWAACVGVAAVSWLIGFVVKLIPVPHTPFLDSLLRILEVPRRKTCIRMISKKKGQRDS